MIRLGYNDAKKNQKKKRRKKLSSPYSEDNADAKVVNIFKSWYSQAESFHYSSDDDHLPPH